MRKIKLKGLKQNNLKNLDIEIPLRSFVVLCGPSGSGKSSLAFQTLFAEGQRRYLESLSNYAKQFVGQAPKPLLDSAENIPPSIALEQRNAIKSSRSTVGTHTEIYDYLRTFFAKIGTPHCPNHHSPMQKHDASIATKDVLNLLGGQRIYIGAPFDFSSEEHFFEMRKKALECGYFKVLDTSDLKSLQTYDLESDDIPLEKGSVFLILDRLIAEEDSELRIFDALSQAFELSKSLNGQSKAYVFSTEEKKLQFRPVLSCSQCDEEFWDLSADLFSFNNNAGACPECRGFGNSLVLDPNKIIPNSSLSIKEGAIVPLQMPSAKREKTRFNKFCEEHSISTTTPWEKLNGKEKELLWKGTTARNGINGFFNYLESKKYKMHVRVFLSRFKSSQPCPLCKGKRLNPKINQVKIKEKSISDLAAMTLEDLHSWFSKLKLNENDRKLSRDMREQILSRLKFLNQIGLSYLSLSRETKTLSGGEFQRTNIAKQIGSELSDTLYVLDEPTIGLHPRDNTRLISLLKDLHARGNSLVVVEHDKEVIKNADYIFELGPQSGIYGGELVFAGTLEDFLKSKSSNTRPYLEGEKQSFFLRENKKPSTKKIKLSGCCGHNLKNIDLEIPLNKIIGISGVSGSGKSSLITQTLYPAIVQKLSGEHQSGSLPFKALNLPPEIQAIDFVDQSRVSKSKRSNISTYLKIFDSVRKIMAATTEAKLMGMNAGTFSLNTKGGRCPHCKGQGIEEVDMLFMDNIELVCEVCNGKKYTGETLKIHYQEKNIFEILEMTCQEARDFFATESSILKSLQVLESLGLGYLKLGQTLDTLSGGESQRLKLSKYLNKSSLKGQIFIFDEPSTGLHFNEITLLIGVLNKLTGSGATVIVIEHNLDILASCDWLIDIGPDSGAEGGTITSTGHPLDFIKMSSYTSDYLNKHIGAGC